jgi:pimeloyl-ACP methyl ester carboxylesterase
LSLRRVALFVAILAAVVFAATPRAAARPAARMPRAAAFEVSIRGRESIAPKMLKGELLAYPPSRATKKPLAVVYLHGRHGLADRGCPYMAGGASQVGWLVCPEAIEKDGIGWSWGGDVLAQSPVVADAIRQAQAAGAAKEPGVAVGFSQGSYVAVDLVKARLAKFRGLVLLGAEMHPSAEMLKSAGVRRIAFGAGSWDGSHDSLVEETERLAAEGIETRFVDLGKVGHTYAPEEGNTALTDAIAWAGES